MSVGIVSGDGSDVVCCGRRGRILWLAWLVGICVERNIKTKGSWNLSSVEIVYVGVEIVVIPNSVWM